jgi:acyl-ACP thioesterase
MEEETFKHIETVRVYAYACDFNKLWKPAEFFRALTEAAAENAKDIGYGALEMAERGCFWVFSRMKIKFLRYPEANDLVTIRTWPRHIQQKLFFIREFEVLDQNSEPLALATSAWLVVNSESRRLVPPGRLEGFPMPVHPEHFAVDEMLDRLNIPDGGEERFNRRAAYSAVDMNGHTNNSRYIEAICDSFEIETFQRYEIDWIQINYDKEVRPNEVLSVNLIEMPGEELLFGLTGNNQTQQARAFEALVKLRDHQQ